MGLLCFAGARLGLAFWESWRVWFVAGCLGMPIITPLALRWLRTEPMALRRPTPARGAEAVALALSGGSVFDGLESTGFTLAYPLFPLLVWAALRCSGDARRVRLSP